MNLAVMQPYLFPYIGYFQLIYASDLFLIYDDVTYIKQGYINRNRILSHNGVVRFTIPVPGASSNKLISDLSFSEKVDKALKMIDQSYSKSPYFCDVFPIIEGVLRLKDRSISSVCLKSFKDIFLYLGVDKGFKKASEIEYDRCVSAQDRLVNFCDYFGASCYINSAGGRELYSRKTFLERGVSLKFIDSLQLEYQQGKNEFFPNLSIIDVLMNCSPKMIRELLGSYELS